MARSGEMIEFAVGSGLAPGYLARPASGSGPGLVVLEGANVHTGGTRVESGTLVLREPRGLGAGPVEVLDGARLVLDIGFTTAKLSARVLGELEPYCKNGERVAVQGKFLWADYASGVGRSKLTTAILDRVVGASVTMRNVNTLRAILAMQA